MPKLLLKVILAVCFSFTSGWSLSQTILDSSATQASFGVNAMYGFFLANQPKSMYVRNDHSYMTEAVVSWQTSGKQRWHRDGHYPSLGVALLHGDVGSRQYLGNITALYPFMLFPLQRTKRSFTSFRLGAGIGWVEKIYDKNTNYKNLMIGSHLNATISLRVQREWEIMRKLSVNVGINFTHLSNGAIRLPNLGLNIPAISAGLRYGGGHLTVPHRERRVRDHRMPEITIYVAGAMKRTYPLETEVYVVPIVTGEFAKPLGNVSRLNAGATISYDRSLSKEVVNAPTYTFDKSANQLQGSVYAGYEHIAGRLSIPVHLGVYVYNNYPVNQLYQTIGLRYRFSKRWKMAVQLKTHFGKADYIQYGIGYKLK
ncbi:MAG: hypothetical protein EOO04_05875 [Chitinophagaceae bacterium]|nr:MAG: hypothetical protein EOO04_05875 [Chitinophagaceae bacterium]